MTGNSGKNKQQSIQSIYSEKNQPVIAQNMGGQKLLPANGNPKVPLSQSIDLYKH